MNTMLGWFSNTTTKRCSGWFCYLYIDHLRIMSFAVSTMFTIAYNNSTPKNNLLQFYCIGVYFGVHQIINQRYNMIRNCFEYCFGVHFLGITAWSPTKWWTVKMSWMEAFSSKILRRFAQQRPVMRNHITIPMGWDYIDLHCDILPKCG